MIEYLKSPRAFVKPNNVLPACSGGKPILKLVMSDASLVCKLKQSRKLSDHS